MTMTASQFLTARQELGMTHEELAGTLDLTPHVIAGIEDGKARVPKAIEKQVRWLLALAKRDAILAASGLPECPVMTEFWRLEWSPDEQSNSERLKALETLRAHVENCPICKAREEYADKHAPPIPDMPQRGWMRGLDFLMSLDQRLPRPLRPPEGDDGEGRRMGIFGAAFFSVMAIGIAVFYAFARLAAWGVASNWWNESLAIIVLVPLAYFVGFFLAGTVYDLTRPMAGRLVGYVLRGGLILPSIYGSIGAVIPFVRPSYSWSYWPGTTLGLGLVGALGGAIMWGVDRSKGRLPRSVT